MKKINYFRILLLTLSFLLIPLVMTLNGKEGFYWTPGDFLVMGMLLFAAGISIEFAFKKLQSNKYKTIAIALIIVTFFLIWAQLAVNAVSKFLFLF